MKKIEKQKERLEVKLIKKLYKEQKLFIKAILKLPKKEIISKAYEIAVKDDLIVFYENNDLTNVSLEDLQKLINTEKLLQAFYDLWLESDANYNDIYASFIAEIIGECDTND